MVLSDFPAERRGKPASLPKRPVRHPLEVLFGVDPQDRPFGGLHLDHAARVPADDVTQGGGRGRRENLFQHAPTHSDGVTASFAVGRDHDGAAIAEHRRDGKDIRGGHEGQIHGKEEGAAGSTSDGRGRAKTDRFEHSRRVIGVGIHKPMFARASPLERPIDGPIHHRDGLEAGVAERPQTSRVERLAHELQEGLGNADPAAMAGRQEYAVDHKARPIFALYSDESPAMKPKHLISLKDYSREDIDEIFALAEKMKGDPGLFKHALLGKTLAMIFQKPSTRTRVSFEVGMFQLGGLAVVLNHDEIHLSVGESVADTARVLSTFADGIMARVFAHQDVLDLAKFGTKPVINGLSDLLHPCQALADFFTLRERFGSLSGLKVAYVGDGNNVCHELMIGAARLGVEMVIATPKGFEPNPLITKSTARDAQKSGTPAAKLLNDPAAAVSGARAVYTDVWTSMGQEAEVEKRKAAFASFTVNAQLMSLAAPDAVFMHCLPAHRGLEVTDEVMDGPQSVVFQQAGNRLHAQKAALMLLLASS